MPKAQQAALRRELTRSRLDSQTTKTYNSSLERREEREFDEKVSKAQNAYENRLKIMIKESRQRGTETAKNALEPPDQINREMFSIKKKYHSSMTTLPNPHKTQGPSQSNSRNPGGAFSSISAKNNELFQQSLYSIAEQSQSNISDVKSLHQSLFNKSPVAGQSTLTEEASVVFDIKNMSPEKQALNNLMMTTPLLTYSKTSLRPDIFTCKMKPRYNIYRDIDSEKLKINDTPHQFSQFIQKGLNYKGEPPRSKSIIKKEDRISLLPPAISTPQQRMAMTFMTNKGSKNGSKDSYFDKKRNQSQNKTASNFFPAPFSETQSLKLLEKTQSEKSLLSTLGSKQAKIDELLMMPLKVESETPNTNDGPGADIFSSIPSTAVGAKPIFSKVVNFVYPEKENGLAQMKAHAPMFRTTSTTGKNSNSGSIGGWITKSSNQSPKMAIAKHLTPITKAKVEFTFKKVSQEVKDHYTHDQDNITIQNESHSIEMVKDIRKLKKTQAKNMMIQGMSSKPPLGHYSQFSKNHKNNSKVMNSDIPRPGQLIRQSDDTFDFQSAADSQNITNSKGSNMKLSQS